MGSMNTVRLSFEDQSFLDPVFMLHTRISLSQIVHMAVELYPKGPKTLEELAMKAVLMEDGFLDREICGQVLWEKSVLGPYALGKIQWGWIVN